MNSAEAANVLAVFHGAYPHVKIDDAVSDTWVNSLMVADYAVAAIAVREWIETQRYWPTVAEFNQLMRTIRQSQAREVPSLPYRTGSRIHCDGTGWFDRGEGMEPCPSCNPWNYQLIRNHDWQNLRQQPPKEWIQPYACRPIETESQVFAYSEAHDAIERGYREHHAEVGTDPAEVDARVANLFSKKKLTVGQRVRR